MLPANNRALNKVIHTRRFLGIYVYTDIVVMSEMVVYENMPRCKRVHTDLANVETERQLLSSN